MSRCSAFNETRGTLKRAALSLFIDAVALLDAMMEESVREIGY